MPPREVYSVNFTGSNLTPVTNESWGQLQFGSTPPGTFPIDSRFRLRAWFDTPSAERLPDAGRDAPPHYGRIATAATLSSESRSM